MRFRNTLHLFIENFKNTYKILFFKIIAFLVSSAILCTLLLPGILTIGASEEWKTLAEAIPKFVFTLLPGHADGDDAAIALFNQALPAFWTYLLTYSWEIAGVCVGIVALYLFMGFVQSIFYYAIGDAFDDRLQTYGEVPVTFSFIKNLGRAIRYSLINVPISFIIDVCTLALCYLALSLLKIFFGMFFAVTIVVFMQAFKFTITCFWLPAMTADRVSLRRAMKVARKEGKGQFWKTFSVYVILIYLIIIGNVLALFCTFGSALILTVPASSGLLMCFQYVNYYTVMGKRYFITYDTIYFNRDKGMNEQFFNKVLEEEKKQNENKNNANGKETNMDYQQLYNSWLNDDRLCQEGKDELASIVDDVKEQEYRFGAELEFGTAGMRGFIGYGTNMMNIYSVMRATQGLSQFICGLGQEAMDRGVVISFDTRRKSEVFAKAAAGVLAKNGIKAYLFDDVHPVPMLSYAVRYLKTIAGIMITASHNPKEYNGYKVYGEDGAQMSPEDTATVVDYIGKIDDFLSVSADENSPLIVPVPKKLDEDYIVELSALTLSPKAVEACGANLKLVYTPVHGSGYVPVMAILNKLGINVTVVEEQTKKDTEFSTVKVPNPEYKETLSMGIELAKKIDASVVFGTDPDSDRLGVALKNAEGEFVALSGNQVGILLLDYILQRMTEDGVMPANAAVVKSFVTTGMAKALCDDYGVTLYETPVGFKFIGEKIKQWEKDGKHTYVFGFEESCGYLRGTHARDKDAVVASMLCAEMVCYYAYVNKSVFDRLQEIYAKYGYVLDKNVSVQYSGLNAMKEMNAVVNALKTMKVEDLGGFKVNAFRDYSAAKRYDYTSGSVEEMDIPKCNCVYYEVDGGSFVCVRPSGTEPKLKIYYSLRAKDEATANADLAKLQEAVSVLLEKAKN